jgi:predicted DCC family thiol-disulfide oxidoreductase YuxK
MSATQKSIAVWFDSGCPLCTREVAIMRRLDWFDRVDFIDIYTAESCPLDPLLLLQRFHAQETHGTIVNGAEAFAALWRHLPLLRPIGELARIPALLRCLEWAYCRFLVFRPKLQKRLSR